jgi:hypothetical protein
MQIPQLIQRKFLSNPNESVTAPLYEIGIAANGVFKRARRFEMTAAIQLEAFNKPLAGLAWETPRVNLANSINGQIFSEILAHARRTTDADNFTENIYAVYWNEAEKTWAWAEVSRARKFAATIADDEHPAYQNALLEIHTHPPGCPKFSLQDDQDESGKFRLFGILLDLHTAVPKLRLRCGIYDHFWEFPASHVVPNLPLILVDLVEENNELLREAFAKITTDENLRRKISITFVKGGCVTNLNDLCK